MDSYLELAETILDAARRPLTAREILQIAYMDNLVPSTLYGKTQHKTLQARLSEDILNFRQRSAFFRTEPGKFFLRALLDDGSIPEKYRQPIVARRRSRELNYERILSVPLHSVTKAAPTGHGLATKPILDLLRSNDYGYEWRSTFRSSRQALIWSFVVVTKDTEVLTYRAGRYREERDSFLQRRSIGFFAPVTESDRTIFDLDDQGIVHRGLRTVLVDLDLPLSGSLQNQYENNISLRCFLACKDAYSQVDLLAIVRFQCPDWFEPLKRRLSINDLRWQNLDIPVNHLGDFDPWSEAILTNAWSDIRAE